MEKITDLNLITHLLNRVERDGIDRYALVESGEIPVFEKYDNYVPYELLRKAYAADKLRSDEAEEQIRKTFEEY